MAAPHAFRSPWLAWLEEVQLRSGRRSFPEDPQLTGLRGWFAAGIPAADAALLAKAWRHSLTHAKSRTPPLN